MLLYIRTFDFGALRSVVRYNRWLEIVPAKITTTHTKMRFVISVIIQLLLSLFFVIVCATKIPTGGILPEDVQLVNENVVLIKGGMVVNADQAFEADVLIEGSIITRVSRTPIVNAPLNARVIDANGKYVMPGGIDPHVHMEMPFMGTVSKDDFETGTRAALAGGTTMIMDFAIPPPNGDHLAVFEEYKGKAASKAVCDYALHVGIIHYDERVKKQMEQLAQKGVNSFKFFMAYKGSLMLEDQFLFDAMTTAKNVGAISMVHAENGDLVAKGQQRMLELGITGPEGHPLSRPSSVEAEAVHRASVIAHQAGAPLYIVHVTSKEAMEEVRRAKEKGYRIVGEPISAGLTLDESHYWDKDWMHAARYVMSPPLRSKEDQKALVNGLKNRILDLVGTDHCSFDSKQKKMGLGDFTKIPNGLPVVEHRMITVYDRMVSTGIISLSDYVRITSTEAAQIFNIYPMKGVIAEGSDADIIILNPNATTTISAKTHHHNVDYSLYEGQVFNGKIEITISAGRVVWENDRLHVKRGSGRFIHTPPFGKMFHGLYNETMHYTPKPVQRK
jgi:dihydropyrimidinase